MIIGSFLIIGTLLALWLTIYEGNNLFRIHTTWLYRDGVMPKVAVVGIYADIALLFIAGLTGTISFLRKGQIWIPVTKGIILNIILWLIYAGIMIAVLAWGFLYKIIGLLIIGSCIWFMLQIWKMIRL
jgi:hypothetical protein